MLRLHGAGGQLGRHVAETVEVPAPYNVYGIVTHTHTQYIYTFYMHAVRCRYLNAFPHLAMMSKTVANALAPSFSFMVMFFIFFIGCAQAFTLVFGGNLVREFDACQHDCSSVRDLNYGSLCFSRVVSPCLSHALCRCFRTIAERFPRLWDRDADALPCTYRRL